MTAQDLKNSILQLAIQGKLAEQRVEEGTAKELLEQIKAEKEQLIKEKKIKKEKPLPEISEDEVPFEIPESWEWVRLNDLSKIIHYGYTASACESGNSKLLRITDIQENSVHWKDVPYCTIKESEYETYGLKSRDIMIARTGGTIGKTYIVESLEEKAVFASYLIRMIPIENINENFIKRFMESPFYWKQLKSSSMGTGQPNVNGTALKNLVVPLPPLKEQKRIVARIEELLVYIEQYDKAYSKLEVFNQKFPEDMQKSILQYAIQGKLVEQRPEEGTAEELYIQIQSEKEKLVKEGRIKKEKPLGEITEDEIPFELPESWKWVRLGHITTYGQTKTKITAKNILPEMWSLDLEDIEKVTGRIIERKKACERKIVGDKVQFEKGNILYSKLRPYLLKILIADADGICTPELVPFSSYGNIEDKYLLWVLKSPYVDYIINTVTYGVKMPRVGTDTMVNLLIPLPPLVEQKRIVDAIESYLPYCQQLLN